MDIQDKVRKIIMDTVTKLVQAADEENYDRDNIIQYAGQILSDLGKFATFENFTPSR